jgi:ketosteroid isomerase-like protein
VLAPNDLESLKRTHAATKDMLLKPGPIDWTTWAAAHYEPNAVLLPSSGKPVEGRDGIARFLASFGTLTHFEAKDEEVGGGGDFAYVRGVYDLTFTGPDGKSVRDAGHYLELWKRQPDGSWRCHLEADTADMP